MTRCNAAAAALLAATLAAGGCGKRQAGPEPGDGPPPGEGAGPARTLWVDLYFPDSFGTLTAERRAVTAGEDADQRLRAIVQALLGGPLRGDLYPILPAGVTVDSAHLAAGGIAYLGLAGAGGAPPPPAGSLAETLIVYSLVNTVLLNLPAADSVVLLWNGEQPASFAGHLDTSRPLAADRGLVRGREEDSR